jgi:GrpB-like predicted nucleotidyltransferase (UPF0157 family)
MPAATAGAPVELVAYDPGWPLQFAEEEGAIRRVLGSFVAGPIEHVGSTAISGVDAKPIIDIMIGVHDLATSRGIVPLLAQIGYLYFPYRADEMHWFCKPSPAFRTHHVHAVPVGSRLWKDRLAFRDYLRRDGETAAAYVQLKRQLAASHRHDREAYTGGKGPFIAGVLERAHAETGRPR